MVCGFNRIFCRCKSLPESNVSSVAALNNVIDGFVVDVLVCISRGWLVRWFRRFCFVRVYVDSLIRLLRFFLDDGYQNETMAHVVPGLWRLYLRQGTRLWSWYLCALLRWGAVQRLVDEVRLTCCSPRRLQMTSMLFLRAVYRRTHS